MKRFFSFTVLALFLASCSGSAPETTNNDSATVVQAAETITFSISGMDCDGCKDAVTAALKEVDGVAEVEVSLEENKAVVKGTHLDVVKLAAAVDEAGYGATPIDPDAPEAPVEPDHEHDHSTQVDSTHKHQH